MASLLVTALGLIAAAAPERPSAAEEGRKVITAMLVVGLIFISVILLGQLAERASHRRRSRRPRAY